MKEANRKIENSLLIPEKENIFTRFFKWIKGIFIKEEEQEWTEDIRMPQAQEITIPKAVKLPERVETDFDDIDENSLEYLSKLSDEELDKIDKQYNLQMEEGKSELEKLEEMLQTYRETIKKLQSQLPNEDQV